MGTLGRPTCWYLPPGSPHLSATKVWAAGTTQGTAAVLFSKAELHQHSATPCRASRCTDGETEAQDEGTSS